MSQEKFEADHSALWRQFENWIKSQKVRNAVDPTPTEDIPHIYRQACYHLSLAKSRMYSSSLIERLNNLVLSGHACFYQGAPIKSKSILIFLAYEFPCLLRKEFRLFMLCFFLLFVPLFTAIIVIQQWPEFAYSVIGPSSIAEIEAMYKNSADTLGRKRGSDSDVKMFGFYILNNVGISFRVFAGGILFGLGTLYFLEFNGLYIGTVIGHLIQVGSGKNILSFVASHSAFELLAIVISGAAGMKLAVALIRPGRNQRAVALLQAAKISVKLIYGVIAMLVIAASIEAFWSSSGSIPVEVKYAAGVGTTIVLLLYFTFAGRRYAA